MVEYLEWLGLIVVTVIALCIMVLMINGVVVSYKRERLRLQNQLDTTTRVEIASQEFDKRTFRLEE